MAAGLDTTLEPMLARLARELPADDYLYEPKWDGFRCLVFRSGGEGDLRSPQPAAARALLPRARRGARRAARGLVRPRRRDRRHPRRQVRLHGTPGASAPRPPRVERLRRETPAFLVAFDALAIGDEDLRDRRFEERRRRLADVLAGACPPLYLARSPSTARGRRRGRAVSRGPGRSTSTGSRTTRRGRPSRPIPCAACRGRRSRRRCAGGGRGGRRDGAEDLLRILVHDVSDRLERHGDLFEPLPAAERRLGFAA